MSVNNLSTTDYSFLHKEFCIDHIFVDKISFIYYCTYIVVVFPPSVIVLCLGLQRWKQQRSSATTMSHSDFFTYNMAAVELIGTLGGVIGICSIFIKTPEFVISGLLIGCFPWNAQMMFPLLICVERYVAVVRPITYLRLRQAAGIRIRNICTVIIWVQCIGGVCGITLYAYFTQVSIVTACVMALCLITVTFCSFSILCVLIRQRPGNVGQDRMQVDKSKRRAFKLILIILGVLFFRFGGNLVCYAFSATLTMYQDEWCLAMTSGYWFALPSSLVLPLLFLHRNGKIPGCKRSSE